MKPLKTTRQVLTWLCIYPPQSNTGKWQKFIYMVFSSTVFVTLLSFMLASMAFIWKFKTIDFDASMDALYPILSWIPLTNGFITMILLKHEIVAILDALSNIYDERKFIETNKFKHVFGLRNPSFFSEQ